ncbi:hypothetical protein GCM10029964_059470 [Kibdelosporangium lantanae]
MDLDAVRTFVAVAHTGRFADAADDLDITPQAVSKRIATLENTLAVRLFTRTARGTQLTSEGQAFLPHARELLRAEERAIASVHPARRPLRVDVIGRDLGPAVVMQAFHREHPDIALDVVTLFDADTAIAAVRDGLIDASFRAINHHPRPNGNHHALPNRPLPPDSDRHALPDGRALSDSDRHPRSDHRHHARLDHPVLPDGDQSRSDRDHPAPPDGNRQPRLDRNAPPDRDHPARPDGYRQPLPDGVHAARVYDESLYLITGPAHPLASNGTVALPRLAGHRIRMPGNVPGTEWAAYYDDLAATFGLAIDPVGPNFGIDALLDAVAADPDVGTFIGDGMRLTVPAGYDLRRVTLCDPTPVYPHSLVWHVDNPHPALSALRNHLRAAHLRQPAATTWTPAWA